MIDSRKWARAAAAALAMVTAAALWLSSSPTQAQGTAVPDPAAARVKAAMEGFVKGRYKVEEVAVVDRVEADQRREQAPVGFGDPFTEQIAVATQPRVEFVERAEQLVDRVFVDALFGGEPCLVDAVVHGVVDVRVHCVDLRQQRGRRVIAFDRPDAVELGVQHPHDLGRFVADDRAVGIICLTKEFSGTTLRNQVLLAGANAVFVRDFDEPGVDSRAVDILLIGGGIDSDDAAPLAKRLEAFDTSVFRFGTLVYAANGHLAPMFQRRYPAAVSIANPLGTDLSSRVGSVYEAVRRAYLDDLVFKEGVSELGGHLGSSIRPTPEVVSRGFLRAVMNRSSFKIVGACLALDVGGATTDLHYTVELVREVSEIKPASGVSVARFVFTDLGIVASRDTLMLQLRGHPRLYEFLARVINGDARETYRHLREGEYEPPPELLSYACVFLALDRFAKGKGPGLPTGNLGVLSQIVLTGGAVQSLDEEVVLRLAALLMPDDCAPPLVQIDRRYQIWVGGITWREDLQ